ncbi:hypothetical protein COU19_01090 [Candidatus Kaiserbacteria bacterium CG10_big_fil_rev_8_21_14_0_10_56_12]|uniref:Uncharacterized protein n=1 Tax=Candidatus Kaiserbacteria bacterium CG10_big_fil_rev_8_21_14_0_10_56_12 TaxID=1974611 RepID=A0A2H0UA66_9BACT|nr:MAG: hypothetical protein COU19_01090 [Candidatus Kaiserbacteria bacterium CG10_big_fil_rev_8_21_14_0_10_56_12]
MGFLLLSGGGIAAPARAEAQAPLVVSYQVAMTAYNAVPNQTDGDPSTTASGAVSNPEVVAARSRDLSEELPFGTIIEIDGPDSKQNNCGFNVVSPILGYRVIADTMNARFTNRVDVLFSTKANYRMSDGRLVNASTILGVCHGVTIRVVGHLDPTQMRHLPKTQAELASIVEGADNGTVLALALK